MRTLYRAGPVLLLLLLGPQLGRATIVNLTAVLSAAEEVPTPINVPSGAGGSATVTLDTATNLLSWVLTWSNLSGPAVGAHFHGPAPVGLTAGVRVNIGTISGLTSPSSGSTTITAAQAADLLNDLWYINIHTSMNSSGEIRGQVVPEPASWILAATAILPLWWMARRKRVGSA